MKHTIHFLASVAVLCISSCSNLRDLQAERQSIESAIQSHQQAIQTLKRGASIPQLPALPAAIKKPVFSEPVSPNQQRNFVSPRKSLAFRYDAEELTWSTKPGAIPSAGDHKTTARDLDTILRGDGRIPLNYSVSIKPENLAATIEPRDEFTKISVAQWANYKAYGRLLQLRKELTALTGKAQD